MFRENAGDEKVMEASQSQKTQSCGGSLVVMGDSLMKNWIDRLPHATQKSHWCDIPHCSPLTFSMDILTLNLQLSRKLSYKCFISKVFPRKESNPLLLAENQSQPKSGQFIHHCTMLNTIQILCLKRMDVFHNNFQSI